MPRLFLRMLAPLGMAFGLYVNNAAAGVGAVGGGALSAFARPSPVQTVQAGECWNENGPDGPGYYPCGDGGGGPIVGPSIGRPDGHGAGGVSPSPASPGLAGVHGANGATGGRVGAPASPGVAGSAPAAPHMAAPASPVGSAPAASHIAAPASPRPGRRGGRRPYWRACLTRPRGRSWRRRGRRRRRPGGRHRTSVSARNGLDVRSDQQASVVPTRVRQQTAAPKIFDEGVHQAADHRYGAEDGREHIEAMRAASA